MCLDVVGVKFLFSRQLRITCLCFFSFYKQSSVGARVSATYVWPIIFLAISSELLVQGKSTRRAYRRTNDVEWCTYQARALLGE